MRWIQPILAAACFQRTEGGWRYLYPRQISIADGGPVRGR